MAGDHEEGQGGGRVSVVVVTYDSEGSIGGCLETIPASIPVLVIDNGSGDRTVQVARAARPSARIVERGFNAGFASSVNLALREGGGPEHWLLLNPDARLVNGALDALLKFSDEHPRAGVVSASLVGEDGRPEAVSGGREPSLASAAVHYLGLGRLWPERSLYSPAPLRGAGQRDWVAATAVLVRGSAVDQVGGLDESFFLYCEDVDWCRRMRDAGWDVWVTADARVVHAGSLSVNSAGSWVDLHRIGSLDRYFRRRHGPVALVVFRVTRAAGLVGRALVFQLAGAIRRRPDLARRARQRWRDARLALAPGRGIPGGPPGSRA